MAMRPEAVEDWFQLVPGLLERGWAEALRRPEGSLSHRPCPWGGYLIKFELNSVKVHNAPANSSRVMVRPEVRSFLHQKFPICGTSVDGVQFLAPGDAIVQGSISWSAVRICSVLFGDISQVMNCLCDCPACFHQKVRPNYPFRGDSACTYHSQDGRYQGFILTRPEREDFFTTYVVFRVPAESFASWATLHFGAALRSARATAEWFLNRPGIDELRRVDERFYVILSIQSFKRGMPLLPAVAGEVPVTAIDAGEAFGFAQWVRFDPAALGAKKFQLARYIQEFLARLGHQVQTFETLDGQQLVPYQCVISREDWDRTREAFLVVYPLQKTAYRHANGGSGAPGIHEEVAPKFTADSAEGDFQARLAASMEPKLVVRRTFLEMEEAKEEEQHLRQNRRPKTGVLSRPLCVN